MFVAPSTPPPPPPPSPLPASHHLLPFRPPAPNDDVCALSPHRTHVRARQARHRPTRMSRSRSGMKLPQRGSWQYSLDPRAASCSAMRVRYSAILSPWSRFAPSFPPRRKEDVKSRPRARRIVDTGSRLPGQHCTGRKAAAGLVDAAAELRARFQLRRRQGRQWAWLQGKVTVRVGESGMVQIVQVGSIRVLSCGDGDNRVVWMDSGRLLFGQGRSLVTEEWVFSVLDL